MPFTKEDLDRITKAIQEKNHTQDADIKALLDLGFVIRTKDEQTTYENNLRTQVRDEVISAEDLPAYKNIEGALEKLTGVKKNDGEKASDFLSRIVGPMKQQLEERQAEIDALKEGKQDDPRIATLQAEMDKQKKEYDRAVKEARGELTKFRMDSEINAVRKAAEAIPMNVPDAVKADVIEARVQRWLADHEIRFNDKGERELFSKKENRVLMNPSTLEHVEPASTLGTYFADIKADAGGTGGTGTGGAGDKAPAGGGSQKSDYSQAKTQVELHEMLSRDGLMSDSEDFIKTYEGTIKGYQEAHGKPMPLRD